MAIKIGSQLQQRIDEEKQKNSAGGNASGSSSVQYYQPGSGSNSSSGSNQSRSYGGTATYTSGGTTRTVQANTTVKRDTDSPLQRAQERTAQQQLQFQPAQQEKYYKGDKPTLNEAYAQAYRISQTDPEQGRKLFSDLDALSKDETSMFYQPYATATNKAIAEMSKLGWDMSGGVTQKWIDDNAYLMQYARTVTGDTPLAPTKKSSKQENAAYWYYQIAKEETKTQKAEQEWSALQNEIAYWTQHPANYSDEQILNKINWKNYSTLNELDKDAALGVPTRLNRGILYSRDNLGGLIWANRNESTGDIHADAVQALLGQGNGWVEDKKVSARLDPTSSSFNPYAVSSTMDDVGMYYGRFGFDQKWLDDNASMKNSMDATEQKNYARVYTAEQTTQKAEAETKALLDKANYYLSKSFDADKIIAALKDDDFAKDYPTLAKMDESLKSGKLLDTTRAIGYDWEDLKRQIVDACEKNKAANPTASANDTSKVLGGTGVFSENAALINAAGEAKLDALMGVVDDHGTEREKGLQKWLRTTTDTLSGFVGWVKDSKPDPIVSAEAMRQVDARNANANYMGLRTVTAGYEQRQTALEKDKQDLEKLNAQIAADEERKTKAGALAPTSGAVSAYAGLDDYNKSLIEMQIEADADPEMISTALSNLSGRSVTVTENDIEQIRAQRTQSEEAPQDTWTPQDENWLTVQKERQAELTRDIEESQAWLDQNLEDYNAKRKEEEKLAKQYMQTSGLAEMLGVSSNDGAVELELMDYLYEVGSTYEETKWSSAMAYDMAITDGQTAETLQPAIQRNLLSNSNDISFLESILTQADERKINLPDGFADNIQRRIDALRKENREYAYCMLDGMENFQSVVAEGRRKYSALKPEDITKDNSYGAAMAGNVAFLYSRNAPLDSNGLPTDARMENALAMTDAEKDRYFYLVETEGYEAANKYLDFLQDSVLQVRKMEGLQQAVQNFASENGWQAALATTASFGTNLLSGAGALYSIWQRITGNEINPYNRAFTASVVTGAARQGTSELIDKASGGSKLAQDGYSIFYNGVDSWLSSVFTGPMLQKMGFLDKLGAAGKKGTQSVLENILGATPMGMRAMDSAIREAKLRGASDSQAMALGLANFVAETFSEGFTYSNIRGAEGKALTGSLKEFLLNLPKDGLEEAFGEGSAELVESMADTWIMGANSKREETIQAYLEQGYPKAVATRMADEQMIKDVFHAACIGFVSSGVSSTLGYAKGRAPEVAAKASNYVVQKVFGPEVFNEIQQAEVAPVRYTQNQATITALGVNAQGSQDTQNPSAATVSEGQGSAITSRNGNAGDMYEEETEAPDVSDMYAPTATEETVTPTEEAQVAATEETVTPTPAKDIQQEKADLTALNEQESQQPAATEETVNAPAAETPAATEEAVDQDEYDSEDTPIEAYDVDNDALAEQDTQAVANLAAQNQAAMDNAAKTAKLGVALKTAASSPNATTATVHMAAVLNDLSVAPITDGDTTHVASAAAVQLAEMAGGSQEAASSILDLLVANNQANNPVALGYVVSWGALTDGETHQQLQNVLQNGTVDAMTLNVLNEAFQNDQNNASFADMLAHAKESVKQHRIAVNAQNQIAAGALDSVQGFAATVAQKQQNLQNAQAGLEQAQAQVAAAQANVDTATAEHLAHADDPSTISPVQQAVKDLEGSIKVEQEYQQSVANAQADLHDALVKKTQAEVDAMTAIHQQATADVEQQVQSEAEAAAQAKAQALIDQQAQEAAAQIAAKQAYDDAVAKYPPSKGFGKTIQMDMVGGETVDVVGVLYHDNDNTIFIGSDGRLIDDNDVIEYLGDGQQAVSDALVNWKKSDNLKDLSSIPWQFDHVTTLRDEDGNTVQAVGFTGTSGPDADGDYQAIWVLGLDGQEHNVSSDIMNTTYSADNFQDANYAINTFFENELAIPVRDSVLGQPVATPEAVTPQDNTITPITPEAVAPEAVTPEAQQPAAATPADVNAQPAEAPVPTAQVPLPFNQPITATYKDVNGKKQTATFVGMYNTGTSEDNAYLVTDAGAHVPLSSVPSDSEVHYAIMTSNWSDEMSQAADSAFNQATNVPLPFDEPIKASYFAPDGKREYSFIGAINYDKNDIGSTYLVADTGELVSASHFMHNSSFRDQIKYWHSWSQNQIKDANAAFTQDTVDNWPVPQKTKAEPYLEKPGKNTPDPDLQLQPWQDPELHGKVKKPTAKKVNPKSKAFLNWWHDPTPGKLLSNPDGSPKVFFRGFGSFTGSLLVNHKSNGKRVDPDQPKKYRNFYSDMQEVAADYAGTNKVLTFRDIVNWETAAAAMKDIGYSLKAEQNPHTGEWGYQVYNKYGSKADGIEHGGWYAENELSAFRHTYGGGLQTKGIHAGYISCQKPLVYDAGGSYYGALYVTATAPDGTTVQNKLFSTDDLAEWAFDHGFDTVIVQNVKDTVSGGGPANNTDIITSSPNQFKSQFNVGKFSKSSNILYSKSVDNGGQNDTAGQLPAVPAPGGVNTQGGSGISFSRSAPTEPVAPAPAVRSTPKSGEQIITTLAKSLGVKDENRLKKYLRSARRVSEGYTYSNGIIHVLDAQDVRTAMHEIGHNFDKRFGMQSWVPDMNALRKRYDQIYGPGFLAQYRADKIPKELMAEFSRVWLRGRDAAVQLAGEDFVSRYEDALNKNGWLQAMKDARDDFEVYNASTAFDQLKSTVHMDDTGKQRRSPGEWLKDFTARKFDSSISFLKTTNTVKEAQGDSFNHANDARTLLLAKGNVSGNMADEILNNRGLITPTGDVVINEKTGKAYGSLASVFGGVGRENMHDFITYLVARSAQDRALAGKDSVSRSIDVDTAVQQAEAAHPEWKSIAEDFYDWNFAFIKTWMLDTGIINQDTFDALKRVHPHYFPAYTVDAVGTAGAARNADGVLDSGLRRAYGSTNDKDNPLARYAEQVQSRVANYKTVELLRAFDAQMQYAQDNGLDVGFLFEPAQPDMTMVDQTRANQANLEKVQEAVAWLKQTNRITDVGAQDLLDFMNEIPNQVFVSKGHATGADVINIPMPDGSVKSWTVYNPQVVKALVQSNDPSKPPAILRAIGHVTRFLCSNATSRSLGFVLQNPMSDTETAMNTGRGGFLGRLWPTYMARQVGTAFELLRNKIAESSYGEKRGMTTSEEYRLFRTFGQLGHRYSFKSGDARSQLADSIFGKESFREKTIKQKALTLVTAPIHGIETLSNFFEDMTRFNEFRHAGYDLSTYEGRLLAGQNSREASTDFSKRGTDTSDAAFMNTLVPFFTSSVNGIYKTARMFSSENAGNRVQTVARIATNSILSSAVLAVLRNMTWSDEEKEAYDQLSDYEVSRYNHIKLPSGEFIRLKRSQDGVIQLADMIGEFVGSCMTGYEGDELGHLAGLARQVASNVMIETATGLAPFTDAANNKTWSGGVIDNYSAQQESVNARYDGDTRKTTKLLSYLINLAAKPVFGVEYSPNAIEYIENQYLGSLGSLGSGVIDVLTGGNVSAGALWSVLGDHLAAKFTVDPVYTNSLSSTFYSERKRLDEAVKEGKNSKAPEHFRSDLTPEQQDAAYQQATALLDKGGSIYETDRTIARLMTQHDMILADETLTQAERNAQSREIRKQINEEYLKANTVLADFWNEYGYSNGLQQTVMNALNLFTGQKGEVSSVREAREMENRWSVAKNDVFTSDSGEWYMQQAEAVYQATMNNAALPHPNLEYTVGGVKHTVNEDYWDEYVSRYRDAYMQYMDGHRLEYEELQSDEDRLKFLRDKAHRKAHDTAIGWYKKLGVD